MSGRALTFLIMLLAIGLEFSEAGTSYDQIPKIADIAPARLPENFWESYDRNEHPYLEASISYLAEIEAFFPDHEIFFLARDCEYLYQIAQRLHINNPKRLSEIHVLAVSSNVSGHLNLKHYLEQKGLLRKSDKPALLVDTGFDGSIPNAIWKLNNTGRRIDSIFISSNHPKIPSSRVSSLVYAKLHDGDHDLASGKLVDEIEGLPHYLFESTSEITRVGDKYLAIAPVELEQIQRSDESRRALSYMSEIRAFSDQKRTHKIFERKLRAFHLAISYLKSSSSASQQELKSIYDGAVKEGGIEFFEDLREAIWKGVVNVPQSQYVKFWSDLGKAMPEPVDMYEDMVISVQDESPEDWLSEDWKESAKNAFEILSDDTEAGRKIFELLWNRPLPRLWSAALTYMSANPHSAIASEELAKSKFLIEMPPKHLNKLLRSTNAPAKNLKVDRFLNGETCTGVVRGE